MKINKSLKVLIIAAQALLIKAEEVEFKVLAVNGTPVLNIDGKNYEMELNEYPRYKTKVNISKFPVNYNYIIKYDNGESIVEPFIRHRNTDDEVYNEFFNRTITVKNHPELPRTYPAFPYFEQSKLYDDSFVATIIVKCDENQLNKLYSDTETKEKIPAEVVYASPYAVKTFSEANFSISGQSTRRVPKLSYKINNLKNDDKHKDLYDRTSIKLRAEHMDSSFMRDKIYGDLLNTLGVPTVQNTFARLFINGRDIGLFDLTDDITNSRYLRETFNNGKKFVGNQENPIYKGDYDYEGIFSDLGYYGDDVDDKNYKVYSYKGDNKLVSNSQHISQDLIPLFKEIDDYKNNKINSVSLDADIFLRSLVMEFLAGAIDNYWNRPGNYYLFKDSTRGKWYFHDADFHYSFGVNDYKKEMLETKLADYPPLIEENDRKERPPLDAFRGHPDMEKKFIEIFLRLLKTSFHEGALFPRIDSIAALIKEDAHWDVTISPKENPNPSAGEDIVYTPDDFDKESSSVDSQGVNGSFPVKYFIKQKNS